MLIQLPSGLVELLIPQAVHMPPPSSIELARLLDVQPGESVLDLGCGSGLLSIAAAKLGARQVIATDVDPSALAAARHNARINGLESRIELRSGSWFDAVGEEERFDVIVATPPQTPGPTPCGPRYGGWDGADNLVSIVAAAPAHLSPVRGRLWLLAISLANPARLRQELARHFADVRLIHETIREFTSDEYESRQPGLMDHLLALRAVQQADFADQEEGGYVFRNLFLRAARPWTK
ncbi:MAG: tRNA (adenine(22)-N(1))-methyltransferase TrmK [Deltaproteobacteria bacterium]|nr:tRNA (adenine(22)-N(1))-methyltransferase TrmK [Deltaproteobacteria bacterium]